MHGFVVQKRLEVTSGDGDHDVRENPGPESHKCHLQARLLFRIVDEDVRHPEGEGVRGPASCNTIPSVAEPPNVLDGGERSGRADFKRLYGIHRAISSSDMA